jgi:hypothetical protein
MEWTLAQRLPTGIARLWAVPGKGFICLVSQQNPESVGTVCDTAQNALRYGLSTTFLSDASSGGRHTRVIIGIAPSPARAIRAHTLGSSISIPVEDGFFESRDDVASPPDSFTLVLPGNVKTRHRK